MNARAPAAPDHDRPLTAAEFAALLEPFQPFERPPALAAAVSGGPDSMALALLASAWAEARGGTLTALVVDHRLRPESAAEAARTAAWLAARGIRPQVLVWTEAKKPASGIQAAARAARYRLLTAACREAGILHLLLAHHADDQAETVAMRAERGSGPDGLAGMPAVREEPGLRLLRPFLPVPKARLIATLRAAGQPWLEDPSNRSPRFRRGRLRSGPDFDSSFWLGEGRRAAAARRERDAALARFLATHAGPHPLGFVRLGLEAWRGLPSELREAVLARLLVTVGAAPYPPPGAVLRRLERTLEAAPPGSRATAAGCVLAVRPLGELVVAREPGRIVHALPIRAGERIVWDRRFALTCHMSPAGLRVAALGEAGRRELPRPVRDRLRDLRLPAAAIASLPGLWREGRLVACPPLAAHGLDSPAGVLVEAAPAPAQPLASAAFAGANVVSNPPRLIYPAGAGRDPAAGTVTSGSCCLGA
ncbi:tRNA lysidine(34) synthetase TilS [Benzoatithermus flavus]|uniref:tRNA(Ile)-lysidine synthase n=1 Tax=Benzoatithermus flavus TaxID=3108223 RepID=A0ABU8XTN6_9PROT